MESSTGRPELTNRSDLFLHLPFFHDFDHFLEIEILSNDPD